MIRGQLTGYLMMLITAIIWGYVFAFLGAKGIGYVARMATFFPIVIVLMLLVGVIAAAGSLGDFDRAKSAEAAFAASEILDKAEKDAAQESIAGTAVCSGFSTKKGEST